MTNARWCTLAIAALLVTARAERIYFVGNSLTDQIVNYPFPASSVAMGETVDWAADVCIGSPLGYHYDNATCGILKGNLSGGGNAGHFQDAMGSHTWDAIALQPFDWTADDGDMREAPVVEWVAEQAMVRNANVQVYVYAQYPRNGGANFASTWNASYSCPTGWDNRSKLYYECVLQQARTRIGTGNPVLMIPVGHVVYELYQRIQNGTGVPGLTNITQLYSDDVHFNPMGCYVCCATFFATIFKRNPAGFPYTGFTGVTAQFAAAVQDAVWKVVTSEPLSGVSATAAAPAVRAAPAHRAIAAGEAYSLTGRLRGAPRSSDRARSVCVMATEGRTLRPMFVDRD